MAGVALSRVEEARGKEGREEGALWKVERLDDSRLVKMIMKKMQDCGTVSWQGEHEYDLFKEVWVGR